jgi:hypothetical protein
MSIMAKTDRFDRRNPVDLEFDHFRGFAVDHATPPNHLEPIARLTIMYMGSS